MNYKPPPPEKGKGARDPSKFRARVAAGTRAKQDGHQVNTNVYATEQISMFHGSSIGIG